MKRIALVAALSLFALGGPALAQDAGSCSVKAVSADGKPLAGAAKNSFLKKCKADACAPNAVENGKPLAGAAKTSFMKKCEAGA